MNNKYKACSRLYLSRIRNVRFILLFLLCIPQLVFCNPQSPVSITLPRMPIAEKKHLAEQWIKTNHKPAEIYAQNILRSMDKKAVLLALEDIPTLSLWLLKKENKLPETLAVYDFDGVFFQSLPIVGNQSLVDYSSTHSTAEIFEIRQSAESTLITNSPLPVYSSSRRDTSDLKDCILIPSGMVYLFWKEGMPRPDYKKLIGEMISLDGEVKKFNSPEVRNMSAVMHYMLGINFLQLPDPWARDSAKSEFQKSASLAGEMKGIHLMLAESFLDLRDYDDALASAQTALEKKPDSAKAYFILGNCYEAKFNVFKALQSYNTVLRLDPNFAAEHKVQEHIDKINKMIH